jgi:hypothetical protein
MIIHLRKTVHNKGSVIMIKATGWFFKLFKTRYILYINISVILFKGGSDCNFGGGGLLQKTAGLKNDIFSFSVFY